MGRAYRWRCLNPVGELPDDTLYAAALTVNDRAMDATPIDDAVMTVIDDLPHEKTMMVSTSAAD